MVLKEKYNKDYSQTSLESSAEEVALKLNKGCECNVSCFLDLDPEAVYRHRLNIAELSKNEIDFYLMGLVRASLMDTGDKGNKRQRKRSSYSYMGKKVCLLAFLYLENVTVYQLKKIRSHLAKHGVVNIQHGNSHKMPHNAFPLTLYKRTENFLRNYLKATQYQHSSKSIALSQPLSKVYHEYRNHELEEKQVKIMSYTTFRSFFRKQFPHVKLSHQNSKQTVDKSAANREIFGIPLQDHEMEIIEEHLIKEEEDDSQQGMEYLNPDCLIYYDASEMPNEEESAD